MVAIKAEFKIEPPELLELIREVRLGIREAHKAKTEMVEANLRLVISIAKKYTNRSLSFSISFRKATWVSKAVEKFEYRRGYKFDLCYLVDCQAITRSIADQARTIRIGSHD